MMKFMLLLPPWGGTPLCLILIPFQVPTQSVAISRLSDLEIWKFTTTISKHCQMLKQHFSKSTEHFILTVDLCFSIPINQVMQVLINNKQHSVWALCICVCSMLYVICHYISGDCTAIKRNFEVCLLILFPCGTMGSVKIRTKMESKSSKCWSWGIQEVHAREVHMRCTLYEICAFVNENSIGI